MYVLLMLCIHLGCFLCEIFFDILMKTRIVWAIVFYIPCKYWLLKDLLATKQADDYFAYALFALVALSWVVTFVNFIRRVRRGEYRQIAQKTSL